MPDISMCSSSTCSLKERCYRNPASGTVPNKFRQSWFAVPPDYHIECPYFWETKPE